MKTAKAARTVFVKLACGHMVDTVEQESWLTPVLCWRCNTHQPVTKSWIPCRVKCLTCKHYHGTSNRATAERAAYRHSERNPSHMVQCWQRDKLLFTTTLAKVQPELPLFQLPPPF